MWRSKILFAPADDGGAGGAGGGAPAPDMDVDQLMADVDAGVDPNASADPAAAEPTAQDVREFEFTSKGKQIKIPFSDPRVTQWLSQGHSFAQDMQEFNQTRSTFENEQKEFQSLRERYGAVDKFAQENPQWWAHVEQEYEKANQGQDPGQGDSPEAAAIKQMLLKELQPVKSFMDQIKTEKEQALIKEHDDKLESVIQSIREQHKDLDWTTADEHGKTLETRVIEHGLKEGIKNFRAAFRDFNHEHLVRLSGDRAKEDLTKAKQAQAKAGLLGKTSAPTKQLQAATNFKNKSYDDLAVEGLKEFGIQ